MAFAKRRTAVVVARKPVTQNPRYLKLAARVSNISKRTKVTAARNEQVLLVLAGAAAPALIQRFTGKSLPTIAGIDPALLIGGLALVASTQIGGRNGERLKAFGTGVAAPAIARAVTTGSIRVSGDDEISGDDDVGADEVDI